MKRLLVGALGFLLAAVLVARALPSEEEKIEAVVAALTEAYTTGDYDGMGRYYAEDVTVVPADYSRPLTGWTRVAQRYKQAHQNLTGAEMIRDHTLVKRRGDFAWVVYEWRFAGLMGAETFAALGHTTLLLEKRGGEWKIVHNHTSALPMPETPQSEKTPPVPSSE